MVYFQQLDFPPPDKGESAAWNVSLSQVSSEEDGGKTKPVVIKAFKHNKVIDVTRFCALQE